MVIYINYYTSIWEKLGINFLKCISVNCAIGTFLKMSENQLQLQCFKILNGLKNATSDYTYLCSVVNMHNAEGTDKMNRVFNYKR